jgi:A/G-specific adenine glycosylase
MTSRSSAKTQRQLHSAEWFRNVRRCLKAWFRTNARDLPWRRTHDPYAIWISEIMLQQTQVTTVERYFPRFLAEFPSVAALAAASESDVLRQWEGLGYYRRARQMHAAARQIVSDHRGQFPVEFDAVRQLPGIGRYTAGAILSIAFDAAHPILEANTIRLLSRLWAYRGNTHDRKGQMLLWNAATSLLSARGNGELNQALMELGSLICTPRNPKCDACPLESLCPTRKLGLQDRIPAPRRKTPVENLCEAAVIVRRNGFVLLRQCGDDERWAGLWDFPRFRLTLKAELNEGIGANDRQIIDGVRMLVGISIARPNHFVTLRHTVTRFRITLHGFVAQCKRAPAKGRSDRFRWVKPEQLVEYPLSVTGRKLARLWRDNHDNVGDDSG